MTKTFPQDDSRLPKIKNTVFALISLFALALVIRNSDIAIKYMTDGLRLCAGTLIPSLFPFMAVSDIVVRCGGAELLGKRLRRPMRALFGVSGDGGCAVLLGFLCGFPVGARAAVSLYSDGRISREELERLLTFSNIPSSAFVINAVGISLFGSRSFGVALYVTVLVSAIVTGLLQRLMFKSGNKKGEPALSEKPSSGEGKKSALGVSTLTEAVSSSALGMLKVCAFVVFFNALVGTLGALTDTLSLPESSRALLFGFFELTGGISAAAALPSAKSAAVLVALISGWSGLSVHLQIMSLCPEGEISFKPYLLSKLFQGALCAALMSAYLALFSPELTLGAGGVSAYAPDVVTERLALPILVLFIFALTLLLAKRVFNKGKEN